CCRSMQVLSGVKGVTLGMAPTSDIAIVGDEDLVRRMVLNLLDNAIKYTPPGGSVSVALGPLTGVGASGPSRSPGLHESSRPSYDLPAKTAKPNMTGSPAMVEIVISDTGIGVPAELASQVFDRFYRGTRAKTEHPRGTGLGLAIARWIAESHGGSITLSSQNGSGSTFTISLPVEST